MAKREHRASCWPNQSEANRKGGGAIGNNESSRAAIIQLSVLYSVGLYCYPICGAQTVPSAAAAATRGIILVVAES